MDFDIDFEVENEYERCVRHRRALHENAEVGFDLDRTFRYVYDELCNIGFTPKRIGRCGIAAEVKGLESGTCIMLRADMDALPISEESGLEFSSSSGAMHACGHDMHAAILLSVSRILFKNKEIIKGRVVFVFQPAEETLAGAKDMIDSGLLELYAPDVAVAIHTLVAIPLSHGSVVVGSGGVGAPTADFFKITFLGSSAHGAAPHRASDALGCALTTVDMLNSRITREVPTSVRPLLTFGSLHSGKCANVIPEIAIAEGTLRSFSDDANGHMRERIVEITSSVASIFRVESRVEFTSGCPTLINDNEVSALAFDAISESKCIRCYYSSSLGEAAEGSEDFAYITHRIPSVMIGVMAGSEMDGYTCSAHNPRTVYDERALKTGIEVYLRCTLGILEKRKGRAIKD